MSFLCPSVGLLKLRRLTKTGFAGPRTGKIRSNVRNRGTSVSFERTGSDLSLASQGGFSALYGEINAGHELDRDTGRQNDPQESYAGVYVGEDAEKILPTTAGGKTRSQDAVFLSQDPATVQSFTFFEETFVSSQHQHDVTEDNNVDSIIDQTGNSVAFKERQTPAPSCRRTTRPSPSSSGSKKAHYNLPTWVRQRRCLPTLNEVDFDKIDAISLGSLSIASEIDRDDNNNHTAAGETATETRSEVTKTKQSTCSVKRTRSDDSSDGVFNDDQSQHPRRHHLHMNMIADDMKAMYVYSPKKTRRSESFLTDDSVFGREPLLIQSSPVDLAPKPRHSRSSRLKKSPSMESLRRRSKNMGSFRKKEKQPVMTNLTKISTKNAKNEKSNGEHGNLEKTYFNAVGSLVRSKPLYMRATSERALDPSAVKLRLESSTARKWRQTGDRSPLSEATNVSRPRPSVCLRMEIVQRPVSNHDIYQGGSTITVPPPTRMTTPRRSQDLQGSVKLPPGKLRPTPQRSNVKSRLRRSSLRRRSTEVTNDSPRPANLTVKEENIDKLFFRRNVEMKTQKVTRTVVNQVSFSNIKPDLRPVNSQTVKEYANKGSKPSDAVTNTDFDEQLLDGLIQKREEVQTQRLIEGTLGKTDEIVGKKEVKKSHQLTTDTVESSVRPEGVQTDEMDVDNVVDTRTVIAELASTQPPKYLIHKPKFAANAVKEARIVSTSKMPAETTSGDDDEDQIPPLPVKMYKSASFTGSSSQSKEDPSATSTSATRSATNVRALQTPLTHQQKRKLRRSAPGNQNARAHRISAVEASREDIVKVVAAMKASLDSTNKKRDTQEKATVRRRTDFVKEDLGKAVAVYAFEARNENDLSLDVGECVQVLNKDDSDWLFVKKHSKVQEEGFVPRIFLQLKSNEGTPSHHNDLDNPLMSSGEQSRPMQLSVTSESNSRLLARANPGPQSVSSDKQSSETDQSVGDTLASNTTIQSLSSFPKNIPGWRFLQPTRKSRAPSDDQSRVEVAARPNKFNTNTRSQSSAPLIETYVVIEDYTACDEDEVSVVEAEVVVVNSGQQHEVDWMWVYVPRTERFGFMPAFSARPLGFHYSDV